MLRRIIIKSLKRAQIIEQKVQNFLVYVTNKEIPK